MGKRSILVSGGAGYIGSAAVLALKAEGYQPVVLDNFVTGHREFVAGIDFVEGDIGDTGLVGKIVKDKAIDAAMHFASLINVGDSVKAPADYYANNVAAGARFIAALQKSGVRKFIFSSTCAVYGVLETPAPLGETAAIRPINPYAQSKRMLEIMLEDFAAAYDFNSVIFRYFNASGAVPGAGVGEWHEPETHLVPNILRAAASDGKIPVQVFGTDYAIPGRDGTAVRDYIHVADLVDAHIRGLRYLDNTRGSHAFNLGTGLGSTVFEVIETTEKIIGRKIRREVKPRRAGDAPYLVADSTKARRELGWEPKQSDLKSIIGTAWEWEKELAAKLQNRH